MVDLRRLLDEHEVVLTEGAVIERLKRNPAVRLDAYVANAILACTDAGRLEMGRIYREYLDVGRAANLPMVVFTPTWRASAERAERAGVGLDVNRVAFNMLDGIRSEYGEYGAQVAIGGLVGPRADAYRPATALPPDAALEYHRPQVEALAFGGVDFVIGATLPALSEGLGIARAAAETGVACLISFVLRPDGTVLDGTVLAAAIRRIDAEVSPWPLGYLVNCVHPETFRNAAAQLRAVAEARLQMVGLQANASRKPLEMLDCADETDSGSPEEFGRQMVELQRDFRLKLLGGCCGTDARHIRAVAEALRR